ncbi:MAG: carbon-nitrogen hydrolase family protein, partial [Hyphomicrobiaceae bacterium]|nr:carbon-nitrogen hydrolase family protein [Hyphomicrobiaceae bacterium]
MTVSSRPIKVAAAQYPLDAFTSIDAYVDKQARWVRQAVDNGAELLVFPEYGAMEYAAPNITAASDLQASLQAVSDAFPQIDAAHVELARLHSVHILSASGPTADGVGRFVNRARLFAPSGKVGVQDKLIMTPFEVRWGISPGVQNRVFETTLGRIGIAICYDSEFPMLVRAQAEAGADIILIPSCTEFMSGYHRVRTAAMARALENGCVTVQSPTVGDALWSPAVDHNAGAAGIFVPSELGFSDTGVIADGVPNRAQWVYGAVDMHRLHQVRTHGEMRNSRDWAKQVGAVGLG